MFVRLSDVPVLLLPNDYPVHGEVLEHRLGMFRLDLFREFVQSSSFISCATLIVIANPSNIPGGEAVIGRF